MNSPFKVLRFEPLLDVEIPRGKGRAGARGSRFKTAVYTAGQIGRTSAKHPQVLVKITSWGRGADSAAESAEYISRDGEIPLEDENGAVHSGRDAVREAQRGWFLEHDLNRKARKTMNLVLAMPKGTDPAKVIEGARRFAHEEFADRQYFMALHVPGTSHRGRSQDEIRHPDHPHVHLQVKSLNDAGERLHVSKSDVKRWREVFAERMRELGVDAHANSRLERFGDKGLKPKARSLHLKGNDAARQRESQMAHDKNVARMLPVVSADYRAAIAIIRANPVLLQSFNEGAMGRRQAKESAPIRAEPEPRSR